MANLNINKVILGGRLTSQPELKQTPQGVSVATFSIAVNRRGKKDEADFINCVAWRQTAELICKYFGKGSSICITGQIQTRSWNDSNGGKRYATEVIADEVYFVDSKAEGSEGGSTYTSTPKPPQNANFKVEQVDFEEVPNDDDLPF
jgi:single-strand DNA-binding protein